jgi:hypothetical protein
VASHGRRRRAAAAAGPPSFSYFAVFSNCPLVAAVLAIAQSIKVLTTWYARRRSRRPVGRRQI